MVAYSDLSRWKCQQSTLQGTTFVKEYLFPYFAGSFNNEENKKTLQR